MKVAIIGGGNMGSVLARNILKSGLVKGSDLLIVDKNLAKRMGLQHSLRCETEERVTAKLKEYTHWILAVKPQAADQMCSQITRYTSAETVIISVMAGVPIRWLGNRLPEVKYIARAIPNLPARVGKGATIYFAPEETGDTCVEELEQIFKSSGCTCRVNEEQLVDAATALFSSGPGFIFYIFEKFVEAAVELGYTPDEAERLMADTFVGAAALLRDTKLPAAMWRERVATKGGTTEAGLKSFDENELGQKIVCGIKQAFDRSLELGKHDKD